MAEQPLSPESVIQAEKYFETLKKAQDSFNEQVKSIKNITSEYEKQKVLIEAEQKYEEKRLEASKELVELNKNTLDIKQKIKEIEDKKKENDEEGVKVAQQELKHLKEKRELLKEEFDQKEK